MRKTASLRHHVHQHQHRALERLGAGRGAVDQEVGDRHTTGQKRTRTVPNLRRGRDGSAGHTSPGVSGAGGTT